MEWSSSITLQYFPNELSYFCIRLTIIVVGRPELTRAKLRSSYQDITPYLFAVADYKCLPKLISCLAPCGGENNATQCAELDLSTCDEDTELVLPQLPPWYYASSETFEDAWHILYIFALSTQVTSKQFDRVKDAVQR